MLFNSLTFFYFILIVVGVNALLPLRYRNAWILIISFLFYMSWSPIYILLLLATAIVDYFVAIRMGELEDKKARRPWLVFSMVFSVGSLLYFKYTNMFVQSAGTIAGYFDSDWKPPFFDIALPLGISFYTFETISYAIDVYRGELKPKKSFFEYLSFLMFFPKLIAGPIVRASELLHQIPKPRILNQEGFHEGINLLFMGFTKKILFADNFAPFVEKIYANPSDHNRWMTIVAIYAYSMQVYFDFSAYSDIARGCAKFLGYDLPLNFNKPYMAISISDFWRRWHMTLSRWLRDYFYIPIGGNHVSKILTYRNLFLTMLVGGLWHGSNWTFVAWGALNGSFLVIEKAWYDLRGLKVPKREALSFTQKLTRGFIVFNLITFTRIFFRAPDFGVALDVIRNVIHPASNEARYDFAMFLLPFFTIAYIMASPYKDKLMQIKPQGMALAGYAAVLLVLLTFGATNAEFIYFQF